MHACVVQPRRLALSPGEKVSRRLLEVISGVESVRCIRTAVGIRAASKWMRCASVAPLHLRRWWGIQCQISLAYFSPLLLECFEKVSQLQGSPGNWPTDKITQTFCCAAKAKGHGAQDRSRRGGREVGSGGTHPLVEYRDHRTDPVLHEYPRNVWPARRVQGLKHGVEALVCLSPWPPVRLHARMAALTCGRGSLLQKRVGVV